MRKQYEIRWREDGDLCIQRFSRYEQAVTWWQVLLSRLRCGDKIEIVLAPRR
jgi:hypothetical protein